MSVDSIANEIPTDIEKRSQIFLYLEQNLSADARKFPFLCFLSYRSVPFDSSNNKNIRDQLQRPYFGVVFHEKRLFLSARQRVSRRRVLFRAFRRSFDDSAVHIWVVDLRPALSSADTRRSRSL